jgi:mono/diheme cytochrome c family protein
MRKRATILTMAIGIVLFAAACGRASEEEINDLLGIVPTPTLSEQQIAQATESAEAAASAAAVVAVTSPGAGSPVVAADGGFDASAGDVTLGRQQFTFQCQQCHRADGAGAGPALVGAGNPATALTDDQIATLVREGHGTANSFTDTRLSDRQLAGIIAFIRDQSE